MSKSDSKIFSSDEKFLDLIKKQRDYLCDLCYHGQSFSEKINKSHILQVEQLKDNLLYLCDESVLLKNIIEDDNRKKACKLIGESIFFLGILNKKVETDYSNSRVVCIIDCIFEQITKSEQSTDNQKLYYSILNHFLMTSIKYKDLLAFEAFNDYFTINHDYNIKLDYLMFISFYVFALIECKPYWLNTNDIVRLNSLLSFVWCCNLDEYFDNIWYSDSLTKIHDIYTSLDESFWVEPFKQPYETDKYYTIDFNMNKLYSYWIFSLMSNSVSNPSYFKLVYNELSQEQKILISDKVVELSLNGRCFDKYSHILKGFGDFSKKSNTKSLKDCLCSTNLYLNPNYDKNLIAKAMEEIPHKEIAKQINQVISEYEGFNEKLEGSKKDVGLGYVQVFMPQPDCSIYDEYNLNSISIGHAEILVGKLLTKHFSENMRNLCKKTISSLNDLTDGDISDIMSIQPDFKDISALPPESVISYDEERYGFLNNLSNVSFNIMDTCVFFKGGAINFKIEIVPDNNKITPLSETDIDKKMVEFRNGDSKTYHFMDEKILDENQIKRRIHDNYFNLGFSGISKIVTDSENIRAYIVEQF